MPRAPDANVWVSMYAKEQYVGLARSLGNYRPHPTHAKTAQSGGKFWGHVIGKPWPRKNLWQSWHRKIIWQPWLNFRSKIIANGGTFFGYCYLATLTQKENLATLAEFSVGNYGYTMHYNVKTTKSGRIFGVRLSGNPDLRRVSGNPAWIFGRKVQLGHALHKFESTG